VPTEEARHEIGDSGPHILATSALDGDEWLVSRPGYFTPEETASEWDPVPVWSLCRTEYFFPVLP